MWPASTRTAWRLVASEVLRVCVRVAAGAAAVGVLVWALDRASVRAERRVWHADLAAWVARLEAPDAAVRDSAMVAVSELASRRWREMGDVAEPGATRSAAPEADTVLAAVRGLTRRLGDADSVLREHAVSAILDVADLNFERGATALADTMRRRSLRAAVRRTADDVLRAAVRPPRRPGVELAALEVLSAVGAPPALAPVFDGIALRDSSPAVRALAAAVALRPIASGDDVSRRVALLRVVLADVSADVRLAAIDALVHDPTPLCRDDALRRQVDALRHDGDAAVRSAITALLDATVTGRACRSAGS